LWLSQKGIWKRDKSEFTHIRGERVIKAQAQIAQEKDKIQKAQAHITQCLVHKAQNSVTIF